MTMNRLYKFSAAVALALATVHQSRAGTAFDLPTAPCDAIAESGKPLNWFKRDVAHNDDRGKQLIAQRLAAYFLSCAWPCE